MLVPVGDAPNPRGAPVLTYLLMAANVAVYVLVTLPLGAVRPALDDPRLAEYLRVMSEALGDRVSLGQLAARTSVYDLFVFGWGFRPAEPSLATVFTSMFLHGGLLHLAGNMLFLWIYGDNVEHRLGPLAYVVAYLGTGAAATAFQALAAPGSPVPMIGASGAISGVLGFYFVWFPRNEVRLLWLLPPFPLFEVPARLVLGLYLVFDNLLPFLVARSPTGVAHGAHIGGFVAGLVLAWALNRRATTRRPAEYARPHRRPPAEAVAEAMRGGRWEEAASAYFALPAHATRGLLGVEETLDLARWLRENGHPEAALILLRRHLRDHPRGPGLAEVHVLAGWTLLEDLGQPTPAYQHFLSALDLEPEPALADLARRGVIAVEALQKRRIGRLHARRAG